MKKTLVIHVKDKSTDFLKVIYEGKGYDVLNKFGTKYSYSPNAKKELMRKMKKYDRIIMLGHGSPQGLLNVEDGMYVGYIIDKDFKDILAQKETISIWCNSDQFFGPLGIKGFHTGMIISEVNEARYCLGKAPLNEQETLDNMYAFSTIVRLCIDEEPQAMKKFILEHYNFDDDVTRFNRDNIIVIE
jgi:hypothetical protein